MNLEMVNFKWEMFSSSPNHQLMFPFPVQRTMINKNRRQLKIEHQQYMLYKALNILHICEWEISTTSRNYYCLGMIVLTQSLWEAEAGELPQITGHFWLPGEILSQNEKQMNKQLMMKFDRFYGLRAYNKNLQFLTTFSIYRSKLYVL